MEQGPNGDLRAILFQLIDERTGNTHIFKAKSHLEDAGPVAMKRKKIKFHLMLANYLADVVADEASKRLLADLNREERAKRCEQTGTNVAERLALVQADVRAKHEEAGDVNELAFLQELEVVTMQSSIERLEAELGRKGTKVA